MNADQAKEKACKMLSRPPNEVECVYLPHDPYADSFEPALCGITVLVDGKSKTVASGHTWEGALRSLATIETGVGTHGDGR